MYCKKYNIPKTFIEFGFSLYEFNCAKLLDKFSGLLIDGDAKTVAKAKKIYPREIKVINCFLTLNNMEFIVDYAKSVNLGILSIDVDGNDFYFLDALLGMGVKPFLIVVEYNATFGHREITVPYDANFDRHKKHKSGWYHGCSLSAIEIMSNRYGYTLDGVTDTGLNAFLIRNDLIDECSQNRRSDFFYKEHFHRNKNSGLDAAAQWKFISHLDYVPIK